MEDKREGRELPRGPGPRIGPARKISIGKADGETARPTRSPSICCTRRKAALWSDFRASGDCFLVLGSPTGPRPTGLGDLEWGRWRKHFIPVTGDVLTPVCR